VGQAGHKASHAVSSPADPSPLVASLAPLPPNAGAVPALSLQFDGDSWVQVTAPDGRTLEESLLHAGDERSYDAGDVGRIVIGNAGVARVRNDGQDVDLARYARSNVARFTVSSDGSLEPTAD